MRRPTFPIAPLPTPALGWARRLLVILFLAYALWGIAGPWARGHYGYHGSFHGAAVRNLLRHGEVIPSPHLGRSAPPKSSRYLHHPILCHQYAVPIVLVFGDSEWALRLVPVLFTLATLLAIVAIGRRLWGPWPALAAAAVFVALPHTMVFCHLIDHETPGLLYSLMGAGGFLLYLRRPTAAFATLSLLGFGLAGLTDWPPYFIAFATAAVGAGYLLAGIAERKEWRLALAAGGAFLALIAFFVTFTAGLGWEPWRVALAAWPLLLAMLAGASAAPAGLGKRKAWIRLRLLIAMAALVLFTFWLHFQLVKWFGTSSDVTQAMAVNRTGDPGALLGKYWDNLRYTFGLPALIACGLWLLSLPIRAATGRPLFLAALPLVLLAGQLLHNLTFPREVAVHNYRTYYFALALPFAVADLLVEIHAGLKSIALGQRATRYRGAPVAVVACVLLCSFLLAATTVAAWPVLKEGRYRSGTLRYDRAYEPRLDRLRVFTEVQRLTREHALVLYTSEVEPAREALWYLDRDHRPIPILPPDRASTLRVLSLPGVPGGPASPRRPLALLTTMARAARSQPAFGKLLSRYRLVRLGRFLLVDFQRPGPDYRAVNVRPRERSWLGRYLSGPYSARRLRRDARDEWRTTSRFGLPLPGPQMFPAPFAGAGLVERVAYLNATRRARRHVVAKRAQGRLQKLIRGRKPRLQDALQVMGTRVTTKEASVVVEVTKRLDPRGQLRLTLAGQAATTQTPWRPVIVGRWSWEPGAVYVWQFSLTTRPRGEIRLTLEWRIDPTQNAASWERVFLGAWPAP